MAPVSITADTPDVSSPSCGSAPPAPRRSRRRRWILVGALLVTTTLVGGTLLFAALPTYRPSLRPGERYGIDVSHHQRDIDWPRVAGDGISYAYIKATEGESFVDQDFATNWVESEAAGLRRGAYHFFSLCSSGAAQARNFLRVVPRDPRALPPAVDLEFSPCRRRPDVRTVGQELRTFVDTVERETGRRVVLYVISSFERRYPVFDGLVRDRWERRLFRRPPGDWIVWQVSDRARVAGVGEPTDLNVWRVDEPAPASGTP